MSARHLMRWLAIATLAAVAAASVAVPTTASAATAATSPTLLPTYCPAGTEPRYVVGAGSQCYFVSTAPLTFKGWAYYDAPMCIALAGVECGPVAWSWTYRGWQRATAPNAGWVYLHPYSGQWRWVWTSQTGWVAMHGVRFELLGQ